MIDIRELRERAEKEVSIQSHKHNFNIWIKIGGHANMLQFYSKYHDYIIDIAEYGRKNSGRYKVKLTNNPREVIK